MHVWGAVVVQLEVKKEKQPKTTSNLKFYCILAYLLKVMHTLGLGKHVRGAVVQLEVLNAGGYPLQESLVQLFCLFLPPMRKKTIRT